LRIEDRQPQYTAHPQEYETRLRVRYAETDQMGVVYNANYIVWFEMGRVEMLRDLGFSYREMEEQDDIHLAVAEVRCRYKAPALYDDIVILRTHLMKVRDSLLHFGYEVLRESDGTVLAEGESIHLVVNADFKRIRLSQKYLPSLMKAAGRG